MDHETQEMRAQGALKMRIRMKFYVTIDEKGIYHVQNAVMGHLGQYHTHTKEDFERWSADIDPQDIIYL